MADIKVGSTFVDGREIASLDDIPVIVDNLESTSTDKALSANQGRVLFQSVSNGKNLIATAITDKGVVANGSDTFSVLANKIGQIETDKTGDATATANDLLSGKTAYAKGAKITGIIPSKGVQTYTPGTVNQVINAGQYLSGNQTILGDADLIPSNIKKGLDIFGVVGTLESGTRFASGTVVFGASDTSKAITGLTFAPKKIVLYGQVIQCYLYGVYVNNSSPLSNKNNCIIADGGIPNTVNNKDNAFTNITSSGFTINLPSTLPGTYNWFAVE